MRARGALGGGRVTGLLVGPAAAFLLILFLAPLAIIVAYGLLSSGPHGEPRPPLTADNLVRALDPVYVGVVVRSLRLAGLTAGLCLLLGFPLAWGILRLRGPARHLLLMAVVLPSWMNLLVKNYAWIVLLRQEGIVNQALVALGVVGAPVPLLFNEAAVLVGLVHTFLPFMVLPLFASLDRMDPHLLEAARDLGASPLQRFVSVVLPQTAAGIGAGVILVFVPALGAFVTPDLLGGARAMMVGNLIQNQMLVVRDWPFGSALSIWVMTASLVMIVALARMAARRGDEGVL